MAEVINTASFDINTTKAVKSVESLSKSIVRLENELVELQKAGDDTSETEAKLAKQTEKLNRLLSQNVTTSKGAAAQSAAYAKSQAILARESEKAEKAIEKVNVGTQKSASIFRRSVAGVKGFGKSIAQDLGGSINAVKGGIEGFSSQIAGIASGFGPYGIAIAGAITILTPFVAGLFEVSAAEKAAAEGAKILADETNKAIGSFVEEIGTSKALFSVLKDGNATQAQRLKAIEQLNESYPTALKNINLLTGGEEALAAAQKAVNAAIIENIVVQAQQNAIAQIVEKQLQNNFKIRENQRKLEAKGLKELTDTGELAAAAISGASLFLTDSDGLEQRNLSLEIAARKQENAALTQVIKDSASASAELRKTLEASVDLVPENKTVIADLNKEVDKNTKTTKANADEQKVLAGTLAALRAEQSKLNEQIEKSTRLDDTVRLKELATRQKAVTKEIQDAEAAIKALTETQQPYVRSLAELRKASGELQKILDEQIDADDIENINRYSIQIAELGDEIKRVEKAIADANKEKLSLLPPEQGAKEIAALRAEAEAVKIELGELAIERNRALLSLQVQENAAIAKVTDNEKEKERIRKEFAARRAALERQSVIQNTQVQIQQAQAELAVLQASGDAEISQLNEQIAKVEELRLELAKLEGEPIEVDVTVNTKGVNQKTKEAIQKAADFAQELSGQIIDFVSSANQAALQAADNAVSKQESVLNELLANEQTASAQQVELERERLDKLNAEREKAKNKEAIIAQAQIAINLALAVARAVAEGGAVAAAVTVGLALSAAVFGFLKAKQASEQAFFEGTTNVRRAAGEPVGRDTVRARLNEGEAVIPTATNKAYSPAVKAIYHGTIPAEALNAFVTDYQSGRVSSKALRTVRDGAAQQQIIVVQPDASVGEYVAKELQKLPQMQLRGDGIHRIVSSKSAKLDKTKKRAKGF